VQKVKGKRRDIEEEDKEDMDESIRGDLFNCQKENDERAYLVNIPLGEKQSKQWIEN